MYSNVIADISFIKNIDIACIHECIQVNLCIQKNKCIFNAKKISISPNGPCSEEIEPKRRRLSESK